MTAIRNEIKAKADEVRAHLKAAADEERARQDRERRAQAEVALALTSEADEWVRIDLAALAIEALRAGKRVVDLSIDDNKAAACRRAGLTVNIIFDVMSGWNTFEVVIP
jgi:hypothetical protein